MFKPEIIETYSVKELAKKGYKENDHYFYIGDARYPTVKIDKNLCEVMGRKFELINLKKNSFKERYQVEYLGERYELPVILVKTRVKRRKVSRMVHADEVIKFNGYNFEFPCECRTLGALDAVKIANWILKTVNKK